MIMNPVCWRDFYFKGLVRTDGVVEGKYMEGCFSKYYCIFLKISNHKFNSLGSLDNFNILFLAALAKSTL